MRKLILLPIFIFSTVFAMAQTVDDVTLVVSGDGATKEAATHVALRSAIEQAYGVFVSANTEILNDELVKDEIATVASGNVKSYTELSATVLPNGNHLVSLQATVSTKSLATYAQSKGASCEFAGATFGANLKLLELNHKNTEIAFDNLLKQCEAIAPYLFEIKLEIGDPTVSGNLPILVTLHSTPNTWEFSNLIVSTLDALKLSDDQIQQLNQIDAKTYGLELIACYRGAKRIDFPSSAYISDYLEYGMFKGGIKDTISIIFNEERQLEAWYHDEDIIQPHRKAYGRNGYTNYYYTKFPVARFRDILKKTCQEYYITDDKGNYAHEINIADLVVGESMLQLEYTPEDIVFSCFYFGEDRYGYDYRISLPYSYIKPYVLKKTNEVKYPEKIIGKKQILLKIPLEILTQISSFKISKHEE